MKVQALILDMDGTIIDYSKKINSSKNSQSNNYITNSGQDSRSKYLQSSWSALGHFANKEELWQNLADYYYPQECLDKEWFDKNCQSLQGLHASEILNKIKPELRDYKEGFHKFTARLHLRGMPQFIVSSGVGHIARQIQTETKLTDVVANEIGIVGGFFSGKGNYRVPLWAKGEIVKNLIKERGYDARRTIFVGDSKNDIPAWEEVGIPIGMDVDKGLEHHVFLNFKNFSQMLSYFNDYLDVIPSKYLYPF